ncbi:MAG: DUF4276 family protein [Flavobacteriales bacterium]|nr:DUF4276 family protein [Flavobacteriales bacterium]
MKQVYVYVEGPSDKLALESLLKPLVVRKFSETVFIDFFPLDSQRNVHLKGTKKAIGILRNQGHYQVVLLPDLYPPFNGARTIEELKESVIARFKSEAELLNISDIDFLLQRFHVHCFKHDLEVLLLAAKEAMSAYLQVHTLTAAWRIPEEEQNHDQPPKRITERLFRERNRKYKDTIDAEAILRNVDYKILVEKCPESFGVFVNFLEGQ